MTDCPEHGTSTGTVCLSCLRDYAAKVWPVHARYWHDNRPGDPESFYRHERWNDIPAGVRSDTT